MAQRRYWTSNELAILTKLYPHHYTIEVAKVLDRTEKSIYSQAKLQGIKKSDEFMAMEMQRQADRLKVVGKQHQFHSAQVPHNKGKKMSAAVYQKSSATMFKKGSMPHNVKHDGYERISKDGYVEVRVALGKFKFKHRMLWEEHHGAIAPGTIIIFKDGNKQNICIENLQAITRKENVLRNSIMRYPPELRQTIKLVHKLKKVINENKTQH